MGWQDVMAVSCHRKRWIRVRFMLPDLSSANRKGTASATCCRSWPTHHHLARFGDRCPHTHGRQVARPCDFAVLNLADLCAVVPYVHELAWARDSKQQPSRPRAGANYPGSAGAGTVRKGRAHTRLAQGLGQQHQADPAQSLGLDEVAVGGAVRVPIYTPGASILSPQRCPGVSSTANRSGPVGTRCRTSWSGSTRLTARDDPGGPAEDMVKRGLKAGHCLSLYNDAVDQPLWNGYPNACATAVWWYNLTLLDIFR